MAAVLRTAFFKASAISLVTGLVFDGLGTYLAYGQSATATSGGLVGVPLSNAATLFTVFSALGGFCIALAVVFAAGAVATLVLGAQTALRPQSQESDGSDEDWLDEGE